VRIVWDISTAKQTYQSSISLMTVTVLILPSKVRELKKFTNPILGKRTLLPHLV